MAGIIPTSSVNISTVITPSLWEKLKHLQRERKCQPALQVAKQFANGHYWSWCLLLERAYYNAILRLVDGGHEESSDITQQHLIHRKAEFGFRWLIIVHWHGEDHLTVKTYLYLSTISTPYYETWREVVVPYIFVTWVVEESTLTGHAHSTIISRYVLAPRWR